MSLDATPTTTGTTTATPTATTAPVGAGSTAELEVHPATEVALPDGTVVHIRPINSGDTAALIDFHEHLSSETIYRRYFAPHPHLAPAEAEHFCVVDGYDRYALAALDGDELVGVARMERLTPPTRAEVAFILTDRFQHRGLGHILAAMLLEAARARDVEEVIADTLADNYSMIHLLADAGYPVNYSRDQGIVRITCTLPLPVGPEPAG